MSGCEIERIQRQSRSNSLNLTLARSLNALRVFEHFFDRGIALENAAVEVADHAARQKKRVAPSKICGKQYKHESIEMGEAVGTKYRYAKLSIFLDAVT